MGHILMFIVHLKLAFVNIVVICNLLFMSVFYFDSIALYCVFFIFFYLLHLLRIKVLYCRHLFIRRRRENDSCVSFMYSVR